MNSSLEERNHIESMMQLLTKENALYKLYCITADYRKNNENKPHYYVLAKSPREAKKRFERWIPWLNVYGCEPCDNEFAKNVVQHPAQYSYI